MAALKTAIRSMSRREASHAERLSQTPVDHMGFILT
jgi:hypothetical protein